MRQLACSPLLLETSRNRLLMAMLMVPLAMCGLNMHGGGSASPRSAGALAALSKEADSLNRRVFVFRNALWVVDQARWKRRCGERNAALRE